MRGTPTSVRTLPAGRCRVDRRANLAWPSERSSQLAVIGKIVVADLARRPTAGVVTRPCSVLSCCRQLSSGRPEPSLISIVSLIVSLPHSVVTVAAGLRPFPVSLSPLTEGSLHLAESGRRSWRPVRPLLAGTQSVVDLGELGGRHCACTLDQVLPAQGGQPGARGNSRPAEPEPEHAVEGQSFPDADCYLDSQARDVGVRRRDDLRRRGPWISTSSMSPRSPRCWRSRLGLQRFPGADMRRWCRSSVLGGRPVLS